MAVPTASNYQPWGTLPPVPQTCFQIYGTKRKAVRHTSEQITTAAKRHCLHSTTHPRHLAGHPQAQSNLPSSPWGQERTRAPASHPEHPSESLPTEEFETAFPEHTSMQFEATGAIQTIDNVQSAPSAVTPEGFYNISMHSPSSSHVESTIPHSCLNNNNHSAMDQSSDWQSSQNPSKQSQHHDQNQRGFKKKCIQNVFQDDFESNDYWDVPQDHHLLKMADEVERARIAMETERAPNQHQNGCSLSSESTLIPGVDIHGTGNHIRCYCKPSWEGLLEPVSYL